jgi:hypothetical protein
LGFIQDGDAQFLRFGQLAAGLDRIVGNIAKPTVEQNMRDLRGEVEFCTMETVLSKAHVKSQLRLLATAHGRFYESPELTTTLAPFSKWETFFTITAVDAGFAEACIRGFTQAKAVIPPRLFAREAEVWPATLRCVARRA